MEPLSQSEHHGNLVLLVEDNESNQFAAVLLLEKHGFRVDVAANGRVALEMCQHRSYKAVFMDCRMPEVDGYQATTELRRREGTGRRTPIIAMTANGEPGWCLAAGMDDHVGKPIDREALSAAIARSLDADRGHVRYGGPISDEGREVRQ